MSNGKTITFDFFLKLCPGMVPAATLRYPRLLPNERAVRVTVAVPAALFTTPTLRADITLDSDVVQTPELTAQVRTQVEQMLGAGGFNVAVSVQESDDAET